MKYLIQGLFFKKRVRLEVDTKDALLPENGLHEFMFSGAIFPVPAAPDCFKGEMSDDLGKSTLYDVCFTADRLSFIRRFADTDETCCFSFERQGPIWVGEYYGYGGGGVKCIITEVPDELFVPPEYKSIRHGVIVQTFSYQKKEVGRMERCSFCGKTVDQVDQLLTGSSTTNKPRVIQVEGTTVEVSVSTKVAICNECVDKCNTAIADSIAKSIEIYPG